MKTQSKKKVSMHKLQPHYINKLLQFVLTKLLEGPQTFRQLLRIAEPDPTGATH